MIDAKPNIYLIKNNINNKIYIGQSIYYDDLYFGSGVEIKKAIKKYGKENFSKTILEFCSKENINEKEIYYIEKYNSCNRKIGYNINKGGQTPYEERNKELKKEFFIYTLDGYFIEKYFGVKDWCRKERINPTFVLRVLQKRRTHYKKYFFSYNEMKSEEIRFLLQKKDRKRGNCKKVIGISPSGEKYEFYNTELFAREHKLSGREIRSCLYKDKIQTKKWKFKYFDEDFLTEQNIADRRCLNKGKGKIIGISPMGESYEFYNTEWFAREHKLYGRCIRDVLYGNQKQHKGWKFKYA